MACLPRRECLSSCLLLLLLCVSAVQKSVGVVVDSRNGPLAFAATTTTRTTQRRNNNSKSQLIQELQTSCWTPKLVLDRVARHVTPQLDPTGDLARLVLVRLSKQCIAWDNQQYLPTHEQRRQSPPGASLPVRFTSQEHAALQAVLETLLTAAAAATPKSKEVVVLDALVEGTKAWAILLRLLHSSSSASSPHEGGSPAPAAAAQQQQRELLTTFWNNHADALAPLLADHQLSGVFWALETASLYGGGSSVVPAALLAAYEDLSLPFCIAPGQLLLREKDDDDKRQLLSVSNLRREVDFGVDEIRTVSNRVVRERRETAWQGDAGVAPFCYGGKAMPTQPWSPTVQRIRDMLARPDAEEHAHGRQQPQQYYDACLLNHYPNGSSGMRFHSDPDQGTLWDYDTAIVSVGATRRLVFRRCCQQQQEQPPHSFVVLHGDVTHMFGACQQDYQHCVKQAESKQFDAAPRISLVYKRSWKLRPQP